jgi:hypothetical protein
MSTLSVYEFIEDHDNAELSTEEWLEQMEDAVVTYNEEYGTDHYPKRTVKIYINRKKMFLC